NTMPEPDGAGDKVMFTVPPACKAVPLLRISLEIVFRMPALYPRRFPKAKGAPDSQSALRQRY
ncbi:MAG TPA: hypothetical protein VGH02_01785, partial [Rhizomicrobium sp.]